MSLRFTLLIVIVLGCCLVSTVSAGSGCDYCSLTPEGGWGAPNPDKYWGMSVDDIMNARSSADGSDTTNVSDTWQPPSIIIPSSNASRFAIFDDYKNKFGGSQSVPGKYSGILKPNFTTKPDFNVSVKPDTSAFIKTDFSIKPKFDVKSDLRNKTDQILPFTGKPVY